MRESHEHGPLGATIRETLGKRRLTFKEFMALALYHPDGGYYVDHAAPGRTADFFTSVSVGACFGELLAVGIHDRWQRRGEPSTFTILEQGGHTGTLAADVLQAINAKFPAFYSSIQWLAVEKTTRAMSDPRLEAHACWEVFRALEEVAADSIDLAFGNELVDAFPVHRVSWLGEGEGWREVYVDSSRAASEAAWVSALGPLSSKALSAEVDSIATEGFPVGYTTEVNLEIHPWLEVMASRLRSGGFLWVIDYGLDEPEYYAASRSEGTLQAYRDHRRVADPLACPGNQDLSAHVNFTHLARVAEEVGYAIECYEAQLRFLAKLAKKPLLEMEQSLAGAAPNVEAQKWIRQFQQLMSMGPTFKVMELVRG